MLDTLSSAHRFGDNRGPASLLCAAQKGAAPISRNREGVDGTVVAAGGVLPFLLYIMRVAADSTLFERILRAKYIAYRAVADWVTPEFKVFQNQHLTLYSTPAWV
jgi:hypothetical protein